MMARLDKIQIRRLRAFALAAALLAGYGCASKPRHGDADLPNFQQVNDTLYRGGQPTRAGLIRLQGMGVKTVLCVRGGHLTNDCLDGLTLACENRAMSPWKPNDENVIWFLKLATDPTRAPIFLHCQHGADRTGYLIAMYRTVVQGWDKQRAIHEMTADGMGFHDLYQGLIDYVREADVERLRTEIGMTGVARTIAAQ